MTRNEHQSAERPKERLTSIAGRPDGGPIDFHVGLYTRGYEVALDQGHIEADLATEERLATFAETSAKCLAAATYDPAGNVADRLMEEAHQRNLNMLGRLEQEVQHARAALRERERELAALGTRPLAPETPLLLGVLGTLAISVTTTATFHDVIFAKLLTSHEQAFIAAGLCGMLLAGAIVWGILSSAAHEGSGPQEWFWTVVGCLFGLAQLLLRFGSVHTERGRYIAYGLAGIEVAVVLGLELFARGHRQSWRAFRQTIAGYEAAEQQVGAARAFLRDRATDLQGCQDRIGEHQRAVTERESLVRSTPLVCDVARETVLMGYAHGRAANRGHLHGSITPTPSRQEILARLGGAPSATSPLVKRS